MQKSQLEARRVSLTKNGRLPGQQTLERIETRCIDREAQELRSENLRHNPICDVNRKQSKNGWSLLKLDLLTTLQVTKMIEGWHNDDYLVLFEGEEEAVRMTELYGVRQHLPEYTVIGLRCWDDFVLRDKSGKLFSIPTVPLEPKHLEPLQFSIDSSVIKPDERFKKKVKWYVKPIMFGGDPSAKENIVWVSFEQHAELVRWWNKLYRNKVVKNA